MKNILYGVLSVATVGIVNLTDSGIIIKDPITGLGNVAAKVKNAIINDFDKGVWIGKRTIN